MLLKWFCCFNDYWCSRNNIDACKFRCIIWFVSVHTTGADITVLAIKMLIFKKGNQLVVSGCVWCHLFSFPVVFSWPIPPFSLSPAPSLCLCAFMRDLPVPAAPERHTWQSSAHHLLPHYPDLPRVISSVVSGVIGPWTFFMSLLTLLSAWLMCSYLWHLSAPLPSPGHLCYLHLPGNSARPLNPGCHLS